MRDEADQGGEGADASDTNGGSPLAVAGESVELFFGVLGQTGADTGRVMDVLTSQLRHWGYGASRIALTELVACYIANEHGGRKNARPPVEASDMTAALRAMTGRADIAARFGIAQVRVLRSQSSGSMDMPARGVAYLIGDITRPEEVSLLREVYGAAFTLVSVQLSRAQHRRPPSNPKPLGDGKSESLGERLADTLPLADYFAMADSIPSLEASLKRLVQLTFAEPFVSPTRVEEAMFFAHAAALRSSDLSRQVGAAITTTDGDIIATGCNEVPKAGGGLYWAEDGNVARDVEIGHDSNAVAKLELLSDAIGRMQAKGWLSRHLMGQSADALARSALLGAESFLRPSRLFDVIEYGRAVHAEMAAITQAAKEGRALQGARLYSTTFPCHLCARHIVASGISEIVFIEPYDKSRTDQMYPDSICMDADTPALDRTNLRRFQGAAPRRYVEYFAMGATPRKTADGKALTRLGRGTRLRFRTSVPLSYLLSEQQVLQESNLSVPNQSA